MQRTISAVCASVSMAALAFHSANAHGYIANPPAYIIDKTILTKYVKTITADVNSAFAGLKWDDSPEANVATFTSSFANTGYKSLRDMLDQQVPDCANTRTDMPPIDVSGLTVMHWQNDEEQKGFIKSHHGPCEHWIDDIMVDRQEDCVATYGSEYPAKIKADFFKCPGKCIERFYWLALHEPKWQVYKQCVPIVNNSGSPTQKQTPSTASNPAGVQNPTQSAPSTASYSSGAQNPTQTAPQVQPAANTSGPHAPTLALTQLPTQMQFTNSGTQSPSQVQGTVMPAGPTFETANEGDYGCQNRALRTIGDAPTHLANGVKVDWTDRRFLRAFNEFAARFQTSD